MKSMFNAFAAADATVARRLKPNVLRLWVSSLLPSLATKISASQPRIGQLFPLICQGQYRACDQTIPHIIDFTVRRNPSGINCIGPECRLWHCTFARGRTRSVPL